jgi:hypothetical protein
MRSRLRAFLVLALIAVAPVIVAARAIAETYMTVGDVPVDVTAKSAAAARDQAIAQAQAKAFDRLVKRLVPNPADQARVRPSQQDIEGMVQDFAIENERASQVRYIGLYSVRFRAGQVRKYLSDLGVTGIDDLQQILILPVYRGAGGAVLWGQSNPWRTAWERGGFGDGPVSLILPNGDALDTAALSAAAAQAGDAAALGAMIQRYRVAGLVVATAEPRDSTQGAGSGLTITAATYDSTGLRGAQTLAVPPAAGEQPGKLLLRGVSATAEALEDGWKGGATGLSGYAPQRDATGNDGEQPAAMSQGTLYPISVALSGLGDWVGIRNRLATVGGVQRVSLDALTRDNAALTVDFAGDPLALQAALADSGYVLVQTAPPDAAGPGIFLLRRGGRQGVPGQLPAIPAPPMPASATPR